MKVHGDTTHKDAALGTKVLLVFMSSFTKYCNSQQNKGKGALPPMSFKRGKLLLCFTKEHNHIMFPSRERKNQTTVLC